MTAHFCRTCARTLVPRTAWDALGPKGRKRLYGTHAVKGPHGLCGSCARWIEDDSDLAYEGGWVRDGLILRPTGEAR